LTEGDEGSRTTPTTKASRAPGKTEPCGKQRHQLGVAQADAFAAANQPVDPADKQNEAGGGEDG